MKRRLLAYCKWKFPVVTHLYEHRLTGVVYSAPDDFAIEVLTPEGIPALERAWSFGAGVVQRRLRAGNACYVGLFGGRIAHYSWVQTAGTHEIDSAGRSPQVQDGELWIYHCRTFDWARGKRIYPTVLRRILWDHSQRGFRRAVVYTTRDNVASQRGILRAGFMPCGDYRALEVGPWTFAWPSRHALPLATVERSKPR